ncbi:MAG TPA: hypothetical protein PLA90_16185, partial [Candidatus Sumerlaeota bacterium]|nr:hypothetical protein [Candidatus Sumerlaeota bacterium]
VFETASKDPLSLGIQNPPLHPRCLIPETPVFVPDELAAMVSTYIGPVVEITTASGRRLTVTTNHPLLGLDGFVAADQIREGDYLVNSPLFDGIIPVYPDQNNMPTTVEQEVRTFAESSGVSSCRVPVSPEDLHGDAINVKGDVNIIATNRFLRGEIKSFQPQHIGKSSLGGRNVFGTSLNGQRNFSAVLFRLGLAAHRIMGGLCAGTPEFRGEAHSTDDIGVSWPTRGDSCFEDLSAHSSPVYSEVLRESQLRFPEFISTTKVVSVNIRSYSGHVYNLQSLSGLYIANGVLSSNCRCCLLPVV